MQQQRLLDLGRVEQAAAALGGDLRMVGQDDRGAEQHVVVGRGQHREGVDAAAAGARVERRDEAPARDLQDRVGGEQRAAQGVAAVEPGAARACGSRPRRSSRLRPRCGGLAETRSRTSSGPSSPSKANDCSSSAAASASIAVAGSAAVRASAWWRVAAGDEEAHLGGHRAPGSALDQALDAQVVEGRRQRRGVGRRVGDAERRRRRVLGRARRVGVQRVALVEQRVDERLEQVGRVAALTRRPRRAARRRPRPASARRAGPCRPAAGRSVSSWTAIQRAFG